MKRLLFPLCLCLAACQQTKTAADKDSAQAQVTGPANFTPSVTVTATPVDTSSITGDFNGDGVTDRVLSQLHKEGSAEEEAQYMISFPGSKLPDMHVIFGRTHLVNEGDLDGDGADELSVFSEPLHGCTYNLNVMTFKKDKWELFAGPILVPTACDPVTDADLQKRIWRENDTVFVWEPDVNDENFKLVKKPLGFTDAERVPGMAAPTALREAHSKE